MIPDPFIRERADAAPLIEGYYLIRRGRAGRVDIPVRIWFGAPIDEDTGEEMDRSHRWQIQVGFQMLEDQALRVGGITIEHLEDLWPACAREPIDEAEWRFRLERAEWAGAYDPNDAFAEIGGRIDPLTCTLP